MTEESGSLFNSILIGQNDVLKGGLQLVSICKETLGLDHLEVAASLSKLGSMRVNLQKVVWSPVFTWIAPDHGIRQTQPCRRWNFQGKV